MAIKGLVPSSEKRYVLKRDTCRGPNGEEVPGSTVFILKTLDGFEIAAVRDSRYVVDEAAIEAAKGGDKEARPISVKLSPYGQAFEACRLGLKGWVNFQDETGVEVPFETEESEISGQRTKIVKQSSLSRISPEDAFELMGQIIASNTLSATEEKK